MSQKKPNVWVWIILAILASVAFGRLVTLVFEGEVAMTIVQIGVPIILIVTATEYIKRLRG